MKLTTFILLISLMQVSAATFGQKVTIKEKNISLREVFDAIRKQTGYGVILRKAELNTTKSISADFNNASLNAVMEKVLEGTEMTYFIEEKNILIQKKEKSLLERVLESFDAIDVRGRVMDETGRPLSGATVAVKGKRQSVNTEANGNFLLKNIDPADVLVITYIGYDRMEIAVSENMGNIGLKIATNPLDEVKIIAYGQTTQRLTTGNSYSIKAQDIEKQPVTNPLLALQGRVPGLVITQSNGNSGSGVTVRVQGQNSLLAGNDPLFVVDGMPYPSQMLATSDVTTALGSSGFSQFALSGQGSPLSYLNLADIESIDVLKDADATSIYGSKAANGAIIITTKKGKRGVSSINLNIQQGLARFTRPIDFMDTQQYLNMRRSALKNDNRTANVNSDYDLTLWDPNAYTNWQKVLVGNTASYTDLNGTISGGSENVQFVAGGTFHNETTVYPGKFGDSRGALHFNISSTSADKRFNFQLTGNYLADRNELPQYDMFATALEIAPNAPSLYSADGTLNWAINTLGNGNSSWINPLAPTLNRYERKTDNIIGSSVLGYEFLPGLKFSTTLGYNRLATDEFLPVYLESLRPERRSSASARQARFSSSTISAYQIEPQLNYVRSFGNSKIDLLLGQTVQDTESEGEAINASGFATNELERDIKSATSITINSTLHSIYKYRASFARANYNWSDKYILNVSARRDGSSRFGPENQFHNFYSVGGAWIFTEEGFFKKSVPFLSFGKLKASYGTTGNDQIGDYTFMDLYASNKLDIAYQGGNSLVPTALPNPYLQWEKTNKLSFGLDLGLFRDRVLLNLGYQKNSSSNQLASYPLPIMAGFSSVHENLSAKIINTSWEFNVNSRNFDGKFKWRTNFNMTIPRNRLASFENLAQSSYANFYIVGESVSLIKAYNFAGIDPAVGVYQFQDANGNLTKSPNFATDRTELINTMPKFYGGLQNDFSFKNFELGFFLQFVKQEGRNPLRFGYNRVPGAANNNQPVSMLGAWTSSGDPSQIQRYNSNSSLSSQISLANQSDAAFQDASFIRLKNVSLSYSFSDKLTKSMYLKNLRLFVHGQNLLTLTRFDDIDPEIQSVGLPPLTVWTFGIKLGI